MASIKLGAIVSDIRGSIGGTVFSRNRYGAYAKERTAPVQPRTSKQTAVRNLFASLTSAWRDLTTGQKVAWNTTGSLIPTVDRLGTTRFLSGAQTFVRVNMVRDSVGLAVSNLPPTSAVVFNITAASTLAHATTNSVVITPTSTGTASDYYQVFCSAPLSPGTTFVGKSQYRLLLVDAGDSATLDVSTAYTAQFGTMGALQIGQRIFVKLVPVNAEGVPGTPLVSFTTLVA